MKTLHLLQAMAILLAASTAYAADPVGTVVRITGRATATAPDNTSRNLELKSPVMQKDRIKTEAGSSLQIMFVDDSVISQGESSEMTIDEYVYNPAKKEDNRCTLNIAKGFFRAVTAKITELNPEKFNIKTKLAVIGVRGCEIGITVSEHDANVYILSLPDGKSIIVTLTPGTGASAVTTTGTVTGQEAIEIIKAGVVVQIRDDGTTSQHEISLQEAIDLIRKVEGPDDQNDSSNGGQGGNDPDNRAAGFANDQNNDGSLDESGNSTFSGVTPPVDDDDDSSGGGEKSTYGYTLKGTGTDWEWGVWGYAGFTPDSVEFSSKVIMPDATVAGLFGAGGYILAPGAGQTAAAIVNYGGVNYCVEGPCEIFVSIPPGTPPGSWSVLTPSPLTDGGTTLLGLSLSGIVLGSGQLSGSVSAGSLTVDGTTFAAVDGGGSASANLTGSGAVPTGIIGAYDCTFGGGAATVSGGFGGN